MVSSYRPTTGIVGSARSGRCMRFWLRSFMDHRVVRAVISGCRVTASHGALVSSVSPIPHNHEDSTSDPISSSNMRPGSTTSTGARPKEAASSHRHSVAVSTITCISK
jgi:hypothetical protein